MPNPIRIALTKGRLQEDTAALFERMGIDVTPLDDGGRKLIIPIGNNIEVVLAKSADVITYVEHGVCDLGVVGKDTLIEHGGALFEVLDLGFGECRFAVAGTPGTDLSAGYRVKRVATKFVNSARTFFEQKGMDVEIIRIEGSVELAPLLGLSDVIFDIVQTGGTLKANGLVVLEYCGDISARLVVNTAAMKLRKSELESLILRMEDAL